MKLIAWDTSAKSGCLAALEWEGDAFPRLVSEWSLNVDAFHSERLLWAVDQVLDAARWELSELNFIGVGAGPGSFTGLRIGITTARTLADVLRIPLIPVSSLAVLARSTADFFNEIDPDTLVIAATDACKGELFALWGKAGDVRKFRTDEVLGSGAPKVVEEAIDPKKLLDRLTPLAESCKSWVVIGDGKERYPELWAGLPKEKEKKVPLPFFDRIRGETLARVAWEHYQSGLIRNPLEVRPRYLRLSNAELKLLGIASEKGSSSSSSRSNLNPFEPRSCFGN